MSIAEPDYLTDAKKSLEFIYKSRHFPICNSRMVNHVYITWNSFLPYLVRLTDRLEDLGFRYIDDNVIAPTEGTDEK